MRKISNPWRYVPKSYEEKDFVAYQKIDQSDLSKIGFSNPIVNGEIIVPNASLNKVTAENANGKEIIRRDLPKEGYLVYYDFVAPNFGDYTKGTHHNSGSYVRERYHRDYEDPFLLHFILLEKEDGIYAYSELINFNTKNIDRIKLLINLFRFCFKTNPLFSLDYNEPPYIVVKEEWEFLRSGTKEEIIEQIAKIIKTNKPSKDFVAYERLKYLIDNSIDGKVACGTNSFDGYFCVKTSKCFILECTHSNNASYILDYKDDWKEISKMTKTEVMGLGVAKRIYHTDKWHDNIKQFF